VALARSLRLYFDERHPGRYVAEPERWRTALRSSRLAVVEESRIGGTAPELPHAPGLAPAGRRSFPGLRSLVVGIYDRDPLSGPRAYRRRGTELLPARGDPVPIRQQGIEGFVDRTAPAPGRRIGFSGWARHANGPVDRIVAFAGRRAVHAEVPSLVRPDVPSASGTGAGMGFHFEIRRPPRGTVVDVYAISAGAAVRLDYLCEPPAEQVTGCGAGRD
jgi:hypothetical protein